MATSWPYSPPKERDVLDALEAERRISPLQKALRDAIDREQQATDYPDEYRQDVEGTMQDLANAEILASRTPRLRDALLKAHQADPEDVRVTQAAVDQAIGQLKPPSQPIQPPEQPQYPNVGTGSVSFPMAPPTPVLTSERMPPVVPANPEESKWFQENPDTTGFMREDSDEVVLNPFNPDTVNQDAVVLNEQIRILQRQGKVPRPGPLEFRITSDQREAFKYTPYAGGTKSSEKNFRDTLVARIATGDPSAKATPEQKSWVTQNVMPVIEGMEPAETLQRDPYVQGEKGKGVSIPFNEVPLPTMEWPDEQLPAAMLNPEPEDPDDEIKRVLWGEDYEIRKSLEGVDVGRPAHAAGQFGRSLAGLFTGGVRGQLQKEHYTRQKILEIFDRIDKGEAPENFLDSYLSGTMDAGFISPQDAMQHDPIRQYLGAIHRYAAANDDERATIRQPYLTPVTEGKFYKQTKLIDKFVERHTWHNPRFKDEFWASKVAGAGGSLFGFAMTTALTRGLAGLPAATVAGGYLGKKTWADARFDDALKHNATIGEAYRASELGDKWGVIEVVPILRFMDRWDKRTGGTLKAKLKEALAIGTKSGSEEAIQEFIDQVTMNIGATMEYDPTRDVFRGTGEAAGVGFTAGGLLAFFASLFGGRRGKMPAPQTEETGEPPLQLTGPPDFTAGPEGVVPGRGGQPPTVGGPAAPAPSEAPDGPQFLGEDMLGPRPGGAVEVTGLDEEGQAEAGTIPAQAGSLPVVTPLEEGLDPNDLYDAIPRIDGDVDAETATGIIQEIAGNPNAYWVNLTIEQQQEAIDLARSRYGRPADTADVPGVVPEEQAAPDGPLDTAVPGVLPDVRPEEPGPGIGQPIDLDIDARALRDLTEIRDRLQRSKAKDLDDISRGVDPIEFDYLKQGAGTSQGVSSGGQPSPIATETERPEISDTDLDKELEDIVVNRRTESISPPVLAEKYGLKEGRIRAGLNRLAAKKLVRQTKKGGYRRFTQRDSLTAQQFIVRQGGIAPGQGQGLEEEFRGKGFVPAFGNIIAAEGRGKSIDDLGEALAEEGYIEEGYTEADVVEYLVEIARGLRSGLTPEAEGTQETIDYGEQQFEEELDQALTDLNVILDPDDVAQVRRLVQDGMAVVDAVESVITEEDSAAREEALSHVQEDIPFDDFADMRPELPTRKIPGPTAPEPIPFDINRKREAPDDTRTTEDEGRRDAEAAQAPEEEAAGPSAAAVAPVSEEPGSRREDEGVDSFTAAEAEDSDIVDDFYQTALTKLSEMPWLADAWNGQRVLGRDGKPSTITLYAEKFGSSNEILITSEDGKLKAEFVNEFSEGNSNAELAIAKIRDLIQFYENTKYKKTPAKPTPAAGSRPGDAEQLAEQRSKLPEDSLVDVNQYGALRIPGDIDPEMLQYGATEKIRKKWQATIEVIQIGEDAWVARPSYQFPKGGSGGPFWIKDQRGSRAEAIEVAARELSERMDGVIGNGASSKAEKAEAEKVISWINSVVKGISPSLRAREGKPSGALVMPDEQLYQPGKQVTWAQWATNVMNLKAFQGQKWPDGFFDPNSPAIRDIFDDGLTPGKATARIQRELNKIEEGPIAPEPTIFEEFREAQRAYRAHEIDDNEFLEVSRRYTEEQKRFDAERGETPPAVKQKSLVEAGISLQELLNTGSRGDLTNFAERLGYDESAFGRKTWGSLRTMLVRQLGLAGQQTPDIGISDATVDAMETAYERGMNKHRDKKKRPEGQMTGLSNEVLEELAVDLYRDGNRSGINEDYTGDQRVALQSLVDTLSERTARTGGDVVQGLRDRAGIVDSDLRKRALGRDVDQTDQGAQPVLEGLQKDKKTSAEIRKREAADKKLELAKLKGAQSKMRKSGQRRVEDDEDTMFGERTDDFEDPQASLGEEYLARQEAAGKVKTKGKFRIVEGPAGPTSTSDLYFSEEFMEEREALSAKIRKILDDMGLKDVPIIVVDKAVARKTDPKTGKVTTAALDAAQFKGTILLSLFSERQNRLEGKEGQLLNHEIIHVLRELGVISQAEWTMLKKAANTADPRTGGKSWREHFDIDNRYSAWSEEIKDEEAVAHFGQSWKDGKVKATGKILAILKRIDILARKIGNLLTLRGFKSKKEIFTNADEVFAKIRSGEISSRKRGPRRGFADIQLQRDVFHGGPNTIEGRMTTDRIGTGAGGLLAGWGLYLAEAEDVGRHYQVPSPEDHAAFIEESQDIISKALGISISEEIGKVPGNMLVFLRDIRTFARYDGRDANITPKRLARMLYTNPQHAMFQKRSGGKTANLGDQPVFEKMITDVREASKKRKGKLYKVTIAPNEDEYLMWDLPLSEQSDKVKANLNKIPQQVWDDMQDLAENYGVNAPEDGADPAYTGEEFYDALVRAASEDILPVSEEIEAEIRRTDVANALDGRPAQSSAYQLKRLVSKYLLSLGIPGNKFLDQYSREKGEGTYNYVIFDDKHILDHEEIMFSWRKPPDVKNERRRQAKKALSYGDKIWDNITTSPFPAFGPLQRMSPLGLLKDKQLYKDMRNLTLGKLWEIEQLEKRISKAFDKTSEKVKKQIYDYLTTKGETPTIIEDEAAREVAIEAKQKIRDIGDDLVASGVLSAEAVAAHKDEYLPRLYLKHVLDESGFGAATGPRVSDRGYTKKRKDIPEDIRELVLGEIKDPAFLAATGIGKSMRDLVVLDLLSQVAEHADVHGNRAWIFEKTLVTFRNKRVSAYFLKSEADRVRRQLEYYPEDRRQAARDIADDMENIANKAIEEAELEVKDTKDYKQIPNTARYGALRGLYVAKEIHDDLVGQAGWQIGEDSAIATMWGAAVKANALWKLGKVALNPPTQVRNAVSNGMLLHISGVNAAMVLPRVTQSISAMIDHARGKKNEYYEEATKHGLAQSSFSQQELIRIHNKLIKLKAKHPHNPFTLMKLAVGIVANKASDLYGRTETVFKLAKFIDVMEKGGTAAEAAAEAHKWVFDYSLAPQFVKTARRSPLGIPFLSFTYFVAPRMLEAFTKRPWVFAPYMIGLAALEAMVAIEYDVDDDDVEKVKNTMAKHLQDKGSAFLLPNRDQHGRWQMADFGYMFPWGGLTEVALAGQRGDFAEAASGLGIMGAPAYDIIAALTTGLDPFTKRKIVNEADPPSRKMASVLGYVWRMAMPGLFTDYGGINKLMDAYGYGWEAPSAIPGTDIPFPNIRIGGTGETRRGEPTLTPTQAALRSVGMNIYPVDTFLSSQQNLKRMENMIQKIRANITRTITDRTLTDDQKDVQIEKSHQMIEQLYGDMDKYRDSVDIHPNLEGPGGGLDRAGQALADKVFGK